MDICLGAAGGALVVEAGAGGVSSLVDVDFNVGFARMASINALRKSGSVAALAVGATLARGAARALPIEQQPSVVFFEHTTPKRTSNGQHYVLIRTAGSAR